MSFLNRMGNASNPYQTGTKKVLAVCSAGLLRSPTVANVLHSEYGYNTRAVGASEEYALIVLDPVLIGWADEIVFVEQKIYDKAWKDFSDLLKKRKNVVLNIPDNYEWNNEDLKLIILEQYRDASK